MGWMLQSLRANAGYLDQCPVELSSALTCIIGARGTCKSTIVETVRFVFDCDPAKVDLMVAPVLTSGQGAIAPRAGLIAATLGGGVARCTLSGHASNPDIATFLIERNIQGKPRVFRDGVQQIDGAEIIRSVEIYSQGDLQAIAEAPERRLALIDRPNQRLVDELRRRRSRVAVELENLGPNIRKRRGEIESRATLVKGLDAYKRELDAVEASRPRLPPELESEQAQYTHRRRAYEQLRIALDTRLRATEAAKALIAERTALRDAATLASSLNLRQADYLATDFDLVLSAADATAERLSLLGSSESLKQNLNAVAAEFERLSARYYELRKEQQVLNESLKRGDALREEIEKMGAIRAEIERLQSEQAIDLAQRVKLRSELDLIADEMYSLRTKQVEAVNAEFGEQIVLTLHQGVVGDENVDRVKELLGGSNLRGQTEVARDLATKVRACDLIDIVESGDARRLADLFQRDLGQMTRLVSHLMDSPKLYALEAVIPEDSLEITMFVRGEARPINQLSSGQKATALLPLILREAEYPLIVDQPEDDLDNAFVSEKLIERILKLKTTRQLVFVTHNANIPVLGDAERVIVMEMDGPSRASPSRSGTVDEMKEDVIRILEGGREAFQQRQTRYGRAAV